MFHIWTSATGPPPLDFRPHPQNLRSLTGPQAKTPPILCFCFLLFSQKVGLRRRRRKGQKRKRSSIKGALSFHLLPANERQQRHLRVLGKQEASAPNHPPPSSFPRTLTSTLHPHPPAIHTGKDSSERLGEEGR